MRAISTVLDVSLCLLLVSASAVTLATTPSATAPSDIAPSDIAPSATATLADESGAAVGPDTADEIAELLATSTARVTYDDGTRTVHDTLAGLLASAALADARQTPPDFARAVTARVGRAVRRPAVRRVASGGAAPGRAAVGVQVVARRTPTNSTPTADSDGRVVAGDTPPPDADVHAATLEVRRVRLTVRTWSA